MRKAEHVLHQARQPLEADALGEAQIDDERPEIGAEWRARLQPRRGLGLEATRAAGANASMQPHPRDLRPNRAEFDAVIDLASLLRALRHVGPAAVAHARQDVALMRRIGDARADARPDAASSCWRFFTNSVASCGLGSAGRSNCSASSADDPVWPPIERSSPQAWPPPSRSTARSPPPAPRATPTTPSRSSESRRSRFDPNRESDKMIRSQNSPNAIQRGGEQLRTPRETPQDEATSSGRLLIGYAAVETLGSDGEFRLCEIKPAAVLRRVMPFERAGSARKRSSAESRSPHRLVAEIDAWQSQRNQSGARTTECSPPTRPEPNWRAPSVQRNQRPRLGALIGGLAQAGPLSFGAPARTRLR